MNLGQFKDKVRRLLGDIDGILLTDDFLADWVYEGQLDLVKRTECLHATTTWTALVTTQGYALPSNFLYAKRVTLGGVVLKEANMADVDILTGAVDETGFTFPGAGGMYYLWNSKIYIAATTVTDPDLIMHYIKAPTELSTDQTDIDIPRYMHDDLITYVVAKSRELLDEMDESRQADAKYNREVTESAATANWQNSSSYPSVRLMYGDY